MYLERVNGMETGNMSTLEVKVDTLLRYCAAESAQLRRHYHSDLQAMLGTNRSNDVSNRIDQALCDLGVPDHLLGYRYLQAAIAAAAEEPDSIYCVTGLLYPSVARRFGTTSSLVERAIRHAVESGWSRCDQQMRQLYFGGKIRPGRQKPTNAEFIARIANIVRK